MKTNIYFDFLLKILIDYQNSSSQDEKNLLWVNKYSDLSERINKMELDALPEIMTLIHPNFLKDKFGNCIKDNLQYTKTHNFSSNISKKHSCKYNLISDNGEKCIFNNYTEIRGKCQADHIWPHSLGGPSIMENRLILCSYHNCSKSNSIFNKFWLSYPIWLNQYLLKIFNQKR